MSVLQITRVLAALSGFPSNPYDGQTFVHSVAGRKFEYTYESGSALWLPRASFGPTTLYVDPVLGTDDLNHGIGPGASAFKSLGFAYDAVPDNIDGSTVVPGGDGATAVLIQLAAGTTVENLDFVGTNRYPNHQATAPLGRRIRVYGTLTVVSNLVATGGTQGAGAVVPSITGAFVAGSNVGKLVKFTSGANNGLFRVIGQTTAGTMYLNGEALTAAPVNLDTYTIYDWGSIIDGWIYVAAGCTALDFRQTRFNVRSNAGYGVAVWGAAFSQIENCMFYNNNLPQATIACAQGSLLEIKNTYIETHGVTFGLQAEHLGHMDTRGLKIHGDDSAFNQGAKAIRAGIITVFASEIDGYWSDCLTEEQGEIYMLSNPSNFIHGATAGGYGVRSQKSSMAEQTGGTNVVYGKLLDNATADVNPSDTSADAASFSWIGP